MTVSTTVSNRIMRGIDQTLSKWLFHAAKKAISPGSMVSFLFIDFIVIAPYLIVLLAVSFCTSYILYMQERRITSYEREVGLNYGQFTCNLCFSLTAAVYACQNGVWFVYWLWFVPSMCKVSFTYLRKSDSIQHFIILLLSGFFCLHFCIIYSFNVRCIITTVYI